VNGTAATGDCSARPFKQQKLSGYQAIFDRDIERSISSWEGRTIDVYDEVKRLTMRVAGSTFLGADVDARADQAMKAFGQMMGRSWRSATTNG
jgi:cytochrome P450